MDGTEASAIIVSTDITAPMMEGPKGMALTRTRTAWRHATVFPTSNA